MRGVYLLGFLPHAADGCSNLLISAGASAGGSTILSYSADSHTLMGAIGHWPAGKHPPGTMREIYSWDEGVRLGAIPEAPETYNVIGNTNEHQLTIAETTFGGLEALNGGGGRAVCNPHYGCIDYGSLIWVTLQRAKTAREAIDTLDHLMQTYGYASEGESFSIADPKEVWLMEIVGKGNYSLGSVWVASRLPDGYVCGHANQARTRTFPRDKPDEVRYAADVVEFARHIGVYSGSDEDFSFSDVYDAVTFAGARQCEARVWTFFRAVASADQSMDDYLDYVQGYNLSHRMPLFVKAAGKMNVNDTMWHMRNHYENTWLDPRKDVGAGAWAAPNRFASLGWSTGGSEYVNERPIGVQYAAWNFIAEQRPDQRYSVLWFGADDSTFSFHTPFYGIASQVPNSWADGTCQGRTVCREKAGLPGTRIKFSTDAQHWIQNMIANHAYGRYGEIRPLVHDYLAKTESELFEHVRQMDEELKKASDENEAAKMASNFSHNWADWVHQKTKDVYGEVFVHSVDGFRVKLDPEEPSCGCTTEYPVWSEDWKSTVAQATGDHYKIPAAGERPGYIAKKTLRAMGGSGRCSSRVSSPEFKGSAEIVV